MARAYSNDLRRKFLQAYDEGEDTLAELAEQFRVSLGWAKRFLPAARVPERWMLRYGGMGR